MSYSIIQLEIQVNKCYNLSIIYSAKGETMENNRRIQLNKLEMEMIAFNEGDSKRIQHFVKVHSFAKLIGELEGVDKNVLFTLEAAALVHDIGIRPTEETYGHCNGKLQEEVGPAYARTMLEQLGFENEVIERVCYLVAHHHTYTDVDGIDYQILLEADFIVNLYEDEVNEAGVKSALDKIFRTQTGSDVCKKSFGV